MTGPLRRRDGIAPLAVADSFVALAVGTGALRPRAAPEPMAATAPFTTPRAQGLGGMSFAQAAAGRTLQGLSATQEHGLPAQTSPEIIDWAATLPEPAASRSHP